MPKQIVTAKQKIFRGTLEGTTVYKYMYMNKEFNDNKLTFLVQGRNKMFTVELTLQTESIILIQAQMKYAFLISARVNIGFSVMFHINYFTHIEYRGGKFYL